MARDYLFDDYEDEDDDEFYDKRAEGKNLRQRKEQKKRERRDATWAQERAVREH